MTEIAGYAVADARVTASLLSTLRVVARRSAQVGATERQAWLVELVQDLAGPALAQASTRHDRALIKAVVDSVGRDGSEQTPTTA